METRIQRGLSRIEIAIPSGFPILALPRLSYWLEIWEASSAS